MSLLLIRHQAKYLRLVAVSPELQIMTLWVLKQDLSTVLKDKSKKEKKSCTLSPFTKSMLSTLALKAFWLYFQELPDKLPKKLESKSIRRSQNGGNKEKLK
jgi:hypothetical protein